MDPSMRDEVVAFLRAWLPEGAKQSYRTMIAADPAGWFHHPHFARGVIVCHALRGNGFTERVLGVPSLERCWADLLSRAVDETGDSDRVPPAAHGPRTSVQ